jgi:SAM-dependent methyltransferase
MADTVETDLGLKFLHQAFGFKALHFGLFKDEHPHLLKGLHLAQEEYTRTLVDLIPPGVRTVLDVGCGIGGTSKVVASRGLHVEGLSPDPYHGEQFQITCGPDVPFHLCKFETLKTDKTYDCLLFGESAQYIDKQAFFPKCVELTHPGSCLVIAELFQVEPSEGNRKCFSEEDFAAGAEKAGFKQDYRRDITKEVLPTLTVALVFIEYGQRLIRFAEETAKRRSKFLWWLARLFYGRKLDRVHALLHEKLPVWLDPQKFEKTTRYVMCRFVRPPA